MHMPPRQLVADASMGFEEGGDRDGGMVHQALTDAIERVPDGNAEIAQLAGGSDAGPHQVRRRMNGAGREDDFPAAKFLRLAIHQRLDADAAQAVEQQLRDRGMGRDVKVWPLAHLGVQISDRRGNALLVGVGDGDREIAVLEEAVLVGQIFVPRAVEGLGERLGMAGPVVPRDPADGNRALLTMPLVVDIQIGLQFSEVGQHAVPVPAGRAARLPVVIVGRRAAIGHLAVDRGAAAEDTGLFVFAQRRFRRIAVVVRDDFRRDL